MKVVDIFKKYNLENSFLLGFYGGGNYGDELLLEVLQQLYKKAGYRKAAILYQTPDAYQTYHHDLGFTLIKAHDKKAVITQLFKSRTFIVGGGGLWGLDSNANILLMSAMLFFARWVLRRQVFLVGVGFYNSAAQQSRVAAWLAGKAATAIIARDTETYDNFKKINPATHQDIDIAHYITQLDLSHYQPDIAQLEQRLHITSKTIFITLRRFKQHYQNAFTDAVADTIKANPDKPIIVAILEPKAVDPEQYKLLQSWQKAYPNVQIIDFSFNPLALYVLFKNHADNLVYIGPQFHGIITADLHNVPFFAMSYDNKVSQLFAQMGRSDSVDIKDVSAIKLQEFVDKEFV